MNFLKRNSPVFIIGIVAGLLVLTLIVMGQNSETGLTLVESLGAVFDVSRRNEKELEDVYVPPTNAFDTQVEQGPIFDGGVDPLEPVQPPPPKPILGVLDVTFNGEQFDPRSAQPLFGQTVRWINSSTEVITIKELITKFPEFEAGIILQPGETFSMELTSGNLWTFKEQNTGAIGRLLIGENPNK